MKAIVLHEFGPASNLKYEDHGDPKLQYDEVLVVVTAVGVNPIDWKIRSGSVQQRMPVELPTILGRDVAGIVRAVGAGVVGFAAGDRVMAFATQTYAELCAVKAADLTHVPEGLEMTQAAVLPLVALTGDQLMREAAETQRGQTILVAGALGSVGRMATYAGLGMGARVIAGVRNNELDEARSLPGVIGVIALDDEMSLGKLEKVDAVANTLVGDITDTLIAKVKPGGVFGSVAAMPSDASLHPTVTANHIMARANARTVALYAGAVNRGELELPIKRVLTLQDAAAAQELGESGGIGGKIVMIVGS